MRNVLLPSSFANVALSINKRVSIQHRMQMCRPQESMKGISVVSHNERISAVDCVRLLSGGRNCFWNFASNYILYANNSTYWDRNDISGKRSRVDVRQAIN